MNYMYRVRAMYNGDFYCIVPVHSIFALFNTITPSDYFSPDVSDMTLGIMIRDKLTIAEQLVTTPVPRELRSEATYEEWVSRTMQLFKYKTKRKLFERMHVCGVTRYQENLTFTPSRHTKLEAWGSEKKDDHLDIIIPPDSGVELMGSTLKKAFTQCSGIGIEKLFPMNP